MSATLEPAVRAVGLSKVYRSGDADLVVFAGLNLEVAQGEKLALVGESGSGKSTLLHLLGGLDRPTEGAIYFGQNDICKLPANELAEFRNRELGFVWQIHSLLAEFTALENVMMPLLIRGQSQQEAEPVSMARLDEVGLRKRATHRAGELSGGEQQMLAMGRALMSRPKLLLLDEPSMGLSPILTEEIFRIIKEINSQGTTILLVEQNALMALSIANRAYVLETGSIVLQGNAADVRDNPQVRNAYLGVG